MKKILAIMLCLAMLVSAVALTVSAAAPADELPASLGVSVADILRPYGITPTFVADNTTTAPVMDGVVNEGEYTSKRVMSSMEDNGTTIPYEVNFGGGCAPSGNNSVTEYVAQDEDNIYVAFVYTENVTSVDWRYNLSQSAIYDGYGISNCGGIKISLPTDVDPDVDYVKDSADELSSNGHIKITGGGGINDDADFNFKTLKYGDNPLTPQEEPDEYDAVAKRNKEGNTFKNVTAEFRLSKEAIMKATKDKETSVDSIGYYCFAERPGKNAIILQTFVPADPVMDGGYTSVDDFLSYNYSSEAGAYYARNWRMLRYICFYADTYVEGQDPAVMPYELLLNGTASETSGTTAEDPANTTTAATTTTAEATTTEADDADETTKAATTTVASTLKAPEKKGCGKSVALSALAIVPVLGLGVAVVSKKKED
ncbi:MAG: hypothetical protein E7679_04365 [Ruminococcaceae bacterium]|nr:hypothetical protein [Oscillospiraceae bacterium]